MEILKETKRYIYYKDCIYSKNCYKIYLYKHCLYFNLMVNLKEECITLIKNNCNIYNAIR